MAGIYIIENNVNGMVYVGRSEIPEHRFKGHMSALRRGKHHNRLLQEDYDEYGREAFSFMVVDTCNDEMMWLRELRWIQYYRSNNMAPIYNDLGQKVENIDIDARLRAVEKLREALARSGNKIRERRTA
jgi:group I intron endonuclease